MLTTAAGCWRRRILAIGAMVLASVALAACSGARVPAEDGPNVAASIQMAGLPATVSAGDFVQLSATVRDAAGGTLGGKTLVWRTSDPAVAKVTPMGLVLALNPGTVTIIATVDRREARQSITVGARNVAFARVAVFLGPEETVYDYNTQRCDFPDTADNEARPIRLADGSLMLVIGNDPNFRVMRGSDFYRLRRECQPSLRSRDDTRAESYHNREWLYSVYREGAVMHALIHNEYHDPVEPNCKPGETGPANPCWYNSITYAASTDNGASFSPPAGQIGLVAPAPVRWDPASAAARGRLHGYFNPSNIVKGGDGYYYALFFALATPATQIVGGCVMRTRTLGDPSSWRAWDGAAFNLAMTSPYAGPPPSACRVVIPGAAFASLTYNSYLGRYVATGNAVFPDGSGSATAVCGIFYAMSSDLVRWSAPQLVMRMLRPSFNGANECPNEPPAASPVGSGLYGTLIDHDSQSINFETTGQSPHVYFMKVVGDSSVPRNLVRRPLIFVKGPGFTGDVSPPQMGLEYPTSGLSFAGGIPNVVGWAFDETRLSRVEILVDGRPIRNAPLGVPRPDVFNGIPGSPPDSGFNTEVFIPLAPGVHTLTVRAFDATGNVTERSVTVTTT